MKLSSTIPTLAVATALASTFTEALPSSCLSHLTRRQSSTQGYYNPTSNGGSLLTGNTASGLGEPFNVIVSGNSDAGVLNQAGFEEFARSFYFSPGSCLNISQGGYQTANLGDGNGARPQTNIMHLNFKQGDGGTCLKSLKGGNHFRYWIQNGTAADSGAIFIAASVELNATLGHMIAPDGYDAGRDQMVGNMTGRALTSPGGFQYTVSKESTQLMSGIGASQINHGIGVDGTVNVLTVKVTKNGTIGAARDSSSGSSGGSVSTPQQSSALPSLSAFDSRLLRGLSALIVGVTSGLLIVA
ncbi:hypothetical protein NDA16_001499 [Ustilago loliicola]|nr:hypothetical protein NDA16_001499 [Ustilago loliicola]